MACATSEPVSEALVRTLEARRCQALLAADHQALMTLLAPELLFVHSTGLVDTREQLLARLAQGMRYRQLQLEVSEVRGSAHTAMAFGHMHAQVEREGVVRAVSSRYLAVWMQREGLWQLMAFQGTPLAAPSS